MARTNILGKIESINNRWKLPVFDFSQEEFCDLTILESGIYQINVDGYLIHFLIRNIGSKNCFVGFHGAQNREKVANPPFFSGNSITMNEDINVILVSDPTLALFPKLNLAWYCGTKDFPAQSILLTLLRHAIQILDTERKIFLGSSGGGFAAMYFGSLLGADHVVALNPQIIIDNYYKGDVSEFKNTCFEDVNHKKVGTLCCTDIREIWNKGTPISYLQNLKDLHVKKHLVFFMEHLGMSTDLMHFTPTKNFNLILGNWGDGHDAPPTDFIKKTLHDIIVGFGKSQKPKREAFEGIKSKTISKTTFKTYNQINNSSLALVHFQGAVDRSKDLFKQGRLQDKASNYIYLLDPTFSKDSELRIGWFQGADDRDSTHNVKNFILQQLEELGIRQSKLILYGSGAGAFAALKLANDLPEAIVAVVNPHFFLQRKAIARHFEHMMQICYPEVDLKNIPENLSEKFSIQIDWKKRKAPIFILQNEDDHVHLDQQIDPFVKTIPPSNFKKYNFTVATNFEKNILVRILSANKSQFIGTSYTSTIQNFLKIVEEGSK